MTDSAQQQTTTPEADGWDWMFVEIMGHRSHWGRTREEERFGAKMLRIDVPVDGDPAKNGWSTHLYGGPAIFSITLTDEASVMAKNKPYEPAARRLLVAFSPVASEPLMHDDMDFSDDEGAEQDDEDLPL